MVKICFCIQNIYILSLSQIFDRVREVAPEQLKKIRLIKGDISEENLDIDPEDEIELIESLNIVFHLAAKAKFSLSLREALKFNTLGTLRVLQLVAKIKNLVVFSHVSTSYCNPNERVFEERYQPAPEDPYKVIELLRSSRESDLDDAEPRSVPIIAQRAFDFFFGLDCFYIINSKTRLRTNIDWRNTETKSLFFSLQTHERLSKHVRIVKDLGRRLDSLVQEQVPYCHNATINRNRRLAGTVSGIC